MARNFGNSNYIDLSDPTDFVTVSSVVNPDFFFVDVSCQLGVCWIPSICKFFLNCYRNIWFDIYSIFF